MHWASSSELKIYMSTHACGNSDTYTHMNTATHRWHTVHISNMPHWLDPLLFIYHKLLYFCLFKSVLYCSGCPHQDLPPLFLSTSLILSPTHCLSSCPYLLPLGDKLFSVCIHISASLRTKFPFHSQSLASISPSLSVSVLRSRLCSLFIQRTATLFSRANNDVGL